MSVEVSPTESQGTSEICKAVAEALVGFSASLGDGYLSLYRDEISMWLLCHIASEESLLQDLCGAWWTCQHSEEPSDLFFRWVKARINVAEIESKVIEWGAYIKSKTGTTDPEPTGK